MLIVVLLAGIYFFFLRADPSTATIDGYRFELESRIFEEGTLLTLRVRNQEGAATPGEPFHLRLQEPSAETISELPGIRDADLSPDILRLLRGEAVYDLLPTENERALRLLFPAFPQVERVTVVVGWGDTERELTAQRE